MKYIAAKKVQGLGKIRGLIGRKPENIYFVTRFGIHTFGMKYAIDIVILDKNNFVVSLKKSLPPNRFFFWNPKYSLVLELISGSIDKSRVQIGDAIIL